MGLISELRRRNVFRVAIAYAVIAWLVAQVAELTFEAFGSPAWVLKTFLAVLVLGFPIVLVFAWAFELTPEGIKLEKDVDRSRSITRQTGRKLDFVIIGVLVLAVGFLLVDRFRPAGGVGSVAVQVATDSTEEDTTTQLARSIAVLPFDNRSNREEDRFFTDGIHDDLLTTIANIGSLKVISRTSVMQYRDTTKRIPEIAAELGVGTVLEGGIQRSGNQVRINVQLIDAQTDEHLWAEIYDRELSAENLFLIQSEVSNAIATALQAELSPEDRDRINSIGTTNLEAYEKYLLGRARWRERSAESMNDAVALFLDAVELDPGFAAAWAGLSDAYRLQFSYNAKPPEEVFPLAEHAVTRALALDGQLAEAHAALGSLRNLQNDPESAAASFERALALNPSYPWTYLWYWNALTALGQPIKGLEMIERGAELDPLSTVLLLNLANAYHVTGEFDKAMSRAERIIEIDPGSHLGYISVGLQHMTVGDRYDEAIKWFRRALEVDPESVNAMWFLSRLYQHLGDIERADRLVLQLQDDYGDSMQTVDALHAQALLAGDREAELEYAEIAASRHSDYGVFWLPALTLLRRDIDSGRIDTALARIVARAPHFETQSASEFTANEMYLGPSAAYLHMLEGRGAVARSIVQRVLDHSDSYPLAGAWGYGTIRAEAFAAIDENERSLTELRRVIDGGFKINAILTLDYSPVFDALRDDPRFLAMRAEIADEAATQLANIQSESSAFEW